MPVNIVLIGPPGSGKGTQAVRLAARYAVPHISTGDILREAVRSGSALGQQVAGIIARGSLVSDQLISDLVRERLAQPDAGGGSILDGFPRTVAQARVLDEIMAANPPLVALIDVPDEAIVERLSTRRVCESCRLTQSVSDAPDGRGESCPYCGGRLVRRNDDEPETVRHRLRTYAAVAGPVIEFYRSRPQYVAIDGLQPPDRVTAALVAEIDRRL